MLYIKLSSKATILRAFADNLDPLVTIANAMTSQHLPYLKAVQILWT